MMFSVVGCSIPTLDKTNGTNEEKTETETKTEENETEVVEEEITDGEHVAAEFDKIEEKDTFDVQVVKAELTEDGTSGFSIEGSDVLEFTIENKGYETITDIEIYVVGYNENGDFTKIQNTLSSVGESKAMVLSWTNLNITHGKTEKLLIRCYSDNFVGVEYIVSSYVNEDGETIENPMAEEWAKVMMGTKTLD